MIFWAIRSYRHVQSVNAFAVMLCGGRLARLVKERSGIAPMRIWGKFALGLRSDERRILYSDLSARWSAAYGRSSMPLMVLGLAVMGFAELFIDGRHVANYAH